MQLCKRLWFSVHTHTHTTQLPCSVGWNRWIPTDSRVLLINLSIELEMQRGYGPVWPLAPASHVNISGKYRSFQAIRLNWREPVLSIEWSENKMNDSEVIFIHMRERNSGLASVVRRKKYTCGVFFIQGNGSTGWYYVQLLLGLIIIEAFRSEVMVTLLLIIVSL